MDPILVGIHAAEIKVQLKDVAYTYAFIIEVHHTAISNAPRTPSHARTGGAHAARDTDVQLPDVADSKSCAPMKVAPQAASRQFRPTRGWWLGTQTEKGIRPHMHILGSVKAMYFDKLKVRVRSSKGRKKNGPPSRVAVVELGNIETVHEPKPIQAVGALCMDRVAVLWSDPTAHTLREVKERMPSRLGARTDQVACALFVKAF
ncbi:hypothetical protein B0H11DRAFT_1899913 [Mycena galericulata]|nr:hypothetical protein B0H11DRAFT_1899913 [Mycena galericulata]